MILVVNAGSSSVKTEVFGADLRSVCAATVSEIGGAAVLKAGPVSAPVKADDHATAVALLLDALQAAGQPLSRLSAAAHRVVHGGADLTAPTRLTPDRIDQIRACIPLAPLHNPANLAAIMALTELAPALPQFASFDTAFHASNPAVETTYAIPAAERSKGIRRYGFHGISYASLVEALPGLTGGPLPHRLLALHLGNGASLCAIRDGKSVATTMGYSPLAGLTMGTRSGDIDGSAVLRMAEEHGIPRTATILNRESGLLGLGGASDMRVLHAAGTDDSRFAIAHFIYWATRHAGAMIAAMEGLDAVAFTGGIGENDAHVRAGIMTGLGYAGLTFDGGANSRSATRLHAEGSQVTAWIVPAEEERAIAANALMLLDRNER